jgi:hypothetical protein
MNQSQASQTNQTSRIEEVAARLKLATLTTGAYRARRMHKRESVEVNEKHNTGSAAKVSVLQCGHPSLGEIWKLQAAARTEHYAITLPSCQDGMRILAAGREFEHSDRMKEYAEKQREHVDVLAAAGVYVGGAEFYSNKARLNGLFDERAWPADARALRAEFVFQTRYLAVPAGDQAWQEWLNESITAADAELRERLESALKRVVERVGNTDGRLFQSVFGNLKEVIDLVPGFDADGRYRRIVEASQEIIEVNAESIRDNKSEREKIARRADALLSVFGELK